MKGFKLSNYNQELTFYELYSDESKAERFYIWQLVSNDLQLKINGTGWKFFTTCTELIELMKEGAVGLTLNTLADELEKVGYVRM